MDNTASDIFKTNPSVLETVQCVFHLFQFVSGLVLEHFYVTLLIAASKEIPLYIFPHYRSAASLNLLNIIMLVVQGDYYR